VRAASAPANQPLAGEGMPLAMESADGATIAYNTWLWGDSLDPYRSWSEQGIDVGDAVAQPTIYLHDVSTGSDESLGAGTMSPAFRGDGAMAYARGVDPSYRLNTPFHRSIVVRDSSSVTMWSTEPAEYSPVLWADQTLIAYRGMPESEGTDIDAPSEERVLAPSAVVAAIDESATRMLIVDYDPYSSVTTALRVVDPADGSTVAKLDVSEIVDPTTGQVPGGIYGDGEWRGDTIVVPADPGLLLLRFADGELTVDSFLHVDIESNPLKEPRFADETNSVVDAWANTVESVAKSYHVRCDIPQRVCTTDTPASPSAFGRPVAKTIGGHQ
jgi:hypothetical protein